MVWKDVTIDVTVAGVIAAFMPRAFFVWLFVGGNDPGFLALFALDVVGPVAAFFTFVCSMGNIPLAAFLYGNGMAFADIIAFLFSDLLVIPVHRANAQYYGCGWHATSLARSSSAGRCGVAAGPSAWARAR